MRMCVCVCVCVCVYVCVWVHVRVCMYLWAWYASLIHTAPVTGLACFRVSTMHQDTHKTQEASHAREITSLRQQKSDSRQVAAIARNRRVRMYQLVVCV